MRKALTKLRSSRKHNIEGKDCKDSSGKRNVPRRATDQGLSQDGFLLRRGFEGGPSEQLLSSSQRLPEKRSFGKRSPSPDSLLFPPNEEKTSMQGLQEFIGIFVRGIDSRGHHSLRGSYRYYGEVH